MNTKCNCFKIELSSLEYGMMAVIQTAGTIGKLVLYFVRWIKDPGTYSHALIIVDSNGKTLEANWHFDYGQLSDYVGCKILIVKDPGMTAETFQKGMDAVIPDIGNLYPWWRLPLFVIGVDKYFKGGQGVCSEETAKFWNATGLYKLVRGIHKIKQWTLKKIRMRYGGQVYGVTPDDLAILWRKLASEGKMVIVYDGVL